MRRVSTLSSFFTRDDQQVDNNPASGTSAPSAMVQVSNHDEESAAKQKKIRKDKSKRKESINTVDASQKKEKRISKG